MLDLNCNPLGSDGVTWIAQALESNKGVKKLYLQNTKYDDDGAGALAKMLRINKTLEYLDLSNVFDNCQYKNNIGDNGETALADVLKECNSSTRKLHIYPYTNTGLRNLTETVPKNKTLELHIHQPEQNSMTLDKETVEIIKPGYTTKKLTNFLPVEHKQGKIIATSSTSVLLVGILRNVLDTVF